MCSKSGEKCERQCRKIAAGINDISVNFAVSVIDTGSTTRIANAFTNF